MGSQIPRTSSVGVNRFGFVDMGAWPEAVQGWWAREGPAQRAIRGGAAMCYPGQDHGEWTLLLCALRAGAQEFAGALHVRPVLAIDGA